MPPRRRDTELATGIGLRLADAIRARDTTQAAVAAATGIAPAQLSRWVQGRATPSPERLVDLCAHLEVSSDWILGLSDERRTAFATDGRRASTTPPPSIERRSDAARPVPGLRR